MDRLEDRIALVTGASRGIGRAIAQQLAGAGALCVVHYKKSDDEAAKTVAEIERCGGRAVAIKADLEKPAELRELAARVKADFGRLDMLVLNAAASAFRPLLESNANNIARTFSITLDASLLLAQEAVALMPRYGCGRIVAVSGWDTLRIIPRHGLLAGAKAALETWVRYLAYELAPRGINVNSVCPGPIEDTLYPRVYGGDQAGYDAWRRKRIEATPKGRLGTPTDVAKVVGFLCSPQSEWITGQNIVCDGGLSLTHLTGA
jgi:enoyl-[acyl-carrier protein] reductase III